jgi:putative heme iron utilization protein
MEADPRCSLLLASIGKGDPLAHPRLTLQAMAERLDPDTDEAKSIRRRYLLQHPKAELYVDFPDFSFWRLKVASGSLNGGFGRAYRMTAEDLLTDMSEFFDFYEFEAEAVGHMNAEHKDAVALYATQLCGAREGAWHLIGIDPEGIQMALGDEILRLTFPRGLTGPHEVRPMLIRLANEARSRIS